MKIRGSALLKRTPSLRSSNNVLRLRAGACAPMLTLTAIFLTNHQSASAQQQRSVPDPAPSCVVDRLTHNASLATDPLIFAPPITSPNGGVDGGCPQVTVTYSSHNFINSPFIAEGGMVDTEIAAVTYTIDPINFPIRIDRIDVLLGTSSLAQQVTEQWSVLVWAGAPNTGTLVYTITSDGKNPPHIVIGPPNNAIVLQAMVDPGDPDQIIVTNNGTNKFSVGYRIDHHNLSATTTCPCEPQFPGLGNYPAICCPPPPTQNLFPTVDNSGLSHPSDNWIMARNCPGATGLCSPTGGWFTSQNAGITGDWNIRVLYTPTGCVTPMGACCLNSGQCLNALTSGQCAAQGGSYQGDNSDCSAINCPIPTGTCCLPGGACSVTTTSNCSAQGGTFLQLGGQCSSGTCNGACCVPATQQCVVTSQNNCAAASGFFKGFGTTCGASSCFGACCLPNGSCTGGLLESQCTSQGGIFQGGGSTCAQVSCPQPVGACCLGTICIEGETQANCVTGFGGVWQGPLSTCSPNPCVMNPCPGDIAPAPNGDGSINVSDLLAVINAWGPCPAPPASCTADVAPQGSHDGFVNVNDLLFIINHWGSCP